jgi:hypothetical protein
MLGERSYLALLERLTQFRLACGQILNYDWISVPLVYTQVNRDLRHLLLTDS